MSERFTLAPSSSRELIVRAYAVSPGQTVIRSSTSGEMSMSVMFVSS
jgi:hypothetical protein